MRAPGARRSLYPRSAVPARGDRALRGAAALARGLAGAPERHDSAARQGELVGRELQQRLAAQADLLRTVVLLHEDRSFLESPGAPHGHRRFYLVPSTAVALSISAENAAMVAATRGISAVASFQSRCSKAS